MPRNEAAPVPVYQNRILRRRSLSQHLGRHDRHQHVVSVDTGVDQVTPAETGKLFVGHDDDDDG